MFNFEVPKKRKKIIIIDSDGEEITWNRGTKRAVIAKEVPKKKKRVNEGMKLYFELIIK